MITSILQHEESRHDSAFPLDLGSAEILFLSQISDVYVGRSPDPVPPLGCFQRRLTCSEQHFVNVFSPCSESSERSGSGEKGPPDRDEVPTCPPLETRRVVMNRRLSRIHSALLAVIFAAVGTHAFAQNAFVIIGF